MHHLRSNVEIYVRFRPPKPSSSISRSVNVTSSDTVAIDAITDSSSGRTSPIPGGTYRFHEVFDMNASNQQVYSTVAYPMVTQLMNGMNCTIMAYGCSGSGKTHTMVGDSGVVPSILSAIFQNASLRRENKEFIVDIRASYCQIYMDKVLDLLKTGTVNVDVDASLPLRMRKDIDGLEEVYVEGLTNKKVLDAKSALDLLEYGNQNRVVASTDMNTYSSRSHSIFILRMEQTNTETGEHLLSSLHLVDLAGSEKIRRTRAEGNVLNQACFVNKSLTTLSKVISALSKKSPHVPYRDSKLTRILTHSLGGNSKTAIILTCSRDECDVTETVATLKFGRRALALPNRPKVNHIRTLEEYKVLLEKSEEAMRAQRDTILALERENATLRQHDTAQNIESRHESRHDRVKSLQRQIGNIRRSLGCPEDFKEAIPELVTETDETLPALIMGLRKSESDVISETSTSEMSPVRESGFDVAHVDYPIMEDDEQKPNEPNLFSPRHFTPRTLAALSDQMVTSLRERIQDLEEQLTGHEFRDLEDEPEPDLPPVNLNQEPAQPVIAAKQSTNQPPQPIGIVKRELASEREHYDKNQGIILLSVGSFFLVSFLAAFIVLHMRQQTDWKMWICVVGLIASGIVAGWGLPPA